jgi:hypothetical protein
MTTTGQDGDDMLFERLKEAVAGDVSVRQLRRRYDSLRRDYEQLLERLEELEERLEREEQPPVRPPAGPTPRPAPQRESRLSEVSEDVVAPLLRLRDEYLATATNIQAIVSGLESLAAGALKGQHGIAPGADLAPTPRERAPQRPREMRVDVKGKDFGELLDFQERLSSLEGVARVSINAIDNERATLVVELDGEDE